MTDLTALRDAVVEAAKVAYGSGYPARQKALDEAVLALTVAELEASKPRLRTAREHAEDGLDRRMNRWYGVEDIERFTAARDDEWMAAIRKLPRYCRANGKHGRGILAEPADDGGFIALEEIEALREGK